MTEYSPIPGYEGLYEASAAGMIRRVGKVALMKLERVTRKDDTIAGLRVMLCKEATRQRHAVHRLIAITFIPNPLSKPFIDHINGDPTDNRVENLRWATPEENMWNRKKLKNNTSGHTGVCYHITQGKWIASIREDGRRRHLGSFDTLEEAAAAYAAEAKATRGEYFCER